MENIERTVKRCKKVKKGKRMKSIVYVKDKPINGK